MVIAELGGFNMGVWKSISHGILARLGLNSTHSYIKKCGEESCAVCKSLWMSIETSPPFAKPEPVLGEMGHYAPFSDVYG